MAGTFSVRPELVEGFFAWQFAQIQECFDRLSTNGKEYFPSTSLIAFE